VTSNHANDVLLVREMKTQKHSKGYVLVFKPEHPFCDHHGFVPEHRVVAEEKIGRYVDPVTEEVHHKDENVSNNHPSNLDVLTKSDHRRIHNSWQKINGEWWKPCNSCKKFLKVVGNFYRRNSGEQEYVSKCILCYAKSYKEKKKGVN
jgi:hypothetical protein